MAQQLRAPNSSSGVSDQQSVGSSPGCGTCVLEQDDLPYLQCPSDGTLSRRSCARFSSAHTTKRNTHHGRVEVNPGVDFTKSWD